MEIRTVDLDVSMIRAMVQEAERGRRACVIAALGEFETSEKLREAADVLSQNPAAMTMRTLATMREIGAEQNTMIIFPVSQDSMMAPSLSPGLMAQAVVLAMAHQQRTK